MTAKQETEVLIVPANAIALLKERNINIKCFLYELAVKRFSDVMWSFENLPDFFILCDLVTEHLKTL